MKKPPSQRPERQPGPGHLYIVGQPYHPDRKMWPQTPQFNYRGGECELLLFFGQPTPAEVRAVKEGRSEFALYDRDGLVVLCYRFVDPRGGVPWSDAPYHYHLVPEAQRIPPPDPRQLSPESRAVLHVILVNATGGEIRALKLVSLSLEFTQAMFRAIAHQAVRPFDSRKYDADLEALYFQFPVSDLLAEACSVRCEGGH
jgi:hypothetical protein